MPSPSSSLATLRPDLAGSLEEFSLAADRQNFIGQRIFPVIDVGKKTGTFGRIPVEQLLQHPETVRAPGSPYNRRKWKFVPDSYRCVENGLEEPVDDAEAEMYKDYFDAEVVSLERARDGVLRAAEKRVADLLFNATTFTPTSITNEWDDLANATPINDIEASVRRVANACGLWPNVLILNRFVFRNLRNCAQIIERIKYSGQTDPKAGNITPRVLAEVFDLEEVIVAGGWQNTANEAQDAAFSQLWSNEYAMVARICRTRDHKEPGVGRIFHYTGDGSDIDCMVESYRDEPVRADIIRARHDVAEKLMYAECADLMDNVTT